MADQDKFDPTHVFTHAYARRAALSNYLTAKLGLREDQFQIEEVANALRLQLKNTNKTITEKHKEEIYKVFDEEEQKKKSGIAKKLPVED
ncbi:hypothetical protein PG993_008258 [Apiospora rasikravindrae]|uniref:Uncharacterized protein n=1 Tax=Apiospora rasikravindrae TaxID=990691 RepID=A0ABR1T068_9PEZI